MSNPCAWGEVMSQTAYAISGNNRTRATCHCVCKTTSHGGWSGQRTGLKQRTVVKGSEPAWFRFNNGCCYLCEHQTYRYGRHGTTHGWVFFPLTLIQVISDSPNSCQCRLSNSYFPACWNTFKLQHRQTRASAIALPYGSFTFSLECCVFEHVTLSSTRLKTVPGKCLSGIGERQMFPCSSATSGRSKVADPRLGCTEVIGRNLRLNVPSVSVYMFMLAWWLIRQSSAETQMTKISKMNKQCLIFCW